jgi:hypothetical protein
MRLVLLCALAFSCDALARTCLIPNCACLPSEFTGFAVLDSSNRYVFSDLRWSDGGVAVIDPSEAFELEPRATQRVPPGNRFLVGGRAFFEDGGTRLGLEFNAYLVGDGGETVSCGVNVAPTAVWRTALEQGTCAALAPRAPCGEGPPRGCSTTGGFALAAAALLVVRRLLSRR